ncbi:hypothetical protein [Leptospira interrogans]|uniref:hypothetical protein n=1 Tax=Leptospira interrogans TaxID=173 RepID=UPI0013A545E4|nr:hypothetical protein [Leptospira interrogans]UML86659.1 hypothetical protein FH587_15455 [Leptospira interrogans]
MGSVESGVLRAACIIFYEQKQSSIPTLKTRNFFYDFVFSRTNVNEFGMTNAKAIVAEIPKELERKELNETLSKGRVSGREQDCY